MKATTFVLRQHERIGEMLQVLERERHLRARLLTDLVEELLSFLALEEDLFYPRVAARARDRDVDRVVRDTRDRLGEEHDALLALLAADDDEAFAAAVARLGRAVAAHARADRAIVPLLERALAETELEEIGARMARFYRDSLGDARDGESNVTIH